MFQNYFISVLGSLSLRLICDFILRYDTTLEGIDLAKKAFVAVGDDQCVNMLSNLDKQDVAKSHEIDGVSVDNQEPLAPSNNEVSAESLNQTDEVSENRLENNQEPLPNSNNELAADSTSKRNRWEQFREQCPYCGIDICLTDVQQEKCKNGHKYVRCALTLRACKLKTYRICIGCDRKVLSKCLSGKLDVESILLNIDVCPFCGCRLIEYCR